MGTDLVKRERLLRFAFLKIAHIRSLRQLSKRRRGGRRAEAHTQKTRPAIFPVRFGKRTKTDREECEKGVIYGVWTPRGAHRFEG